MRLIDADWVAERLKEWRNWIAETYGENDDYVLCLDTVLMELDDAPTANASERHGRWETDGMPTDDGEYLMTRCTVCGTPYEYGHNDNYCGYCGAKMDEVKNETN